MFLENHTLYHKTGCPYCLKVLNYAKANDIQLDMANTLESENAARLIEIGGKRQVPCLVIDGKALYESDDIIAYLAQRCS